MNRVEIKRLILRIIWIICAMLTGIFFAEWVMASKIFNFYLLLMFIFIGLTSGILAYIIRED